MTWLKEYTNRDESYWMARVQNLISSNTTDREDGHGDTDLKWVHRLVDEVTNNLPPDEGYDGNMRTAAILSAVLGLWYNQVHLAKCHDPNRPTFIRQQAYLRRQDWMLAFIQNLFDFSGAPTYFPGQKWQFPFDPEARGGEFV